MLAQENSIKFEYDAIRQEIIEIEHECSLIEHIPKHIFCFNGNDLSFRLTKALNSVLMNPKSFPRRDSAMFSRRTFKQKISKSSEKIPEQKFRRATTNKISLKPTFYSPKKEKIPKKERKRKSIVFPANEKKSSPPMNRSKQNLTVIKEAVNVKSDDSRVDRVYPQITEPNAAAKVRKHSPDKASKELKDLLEAEILEFDSRTKRTSTWLSARRELELSFDDTLESFSPEKDTVHDEIWPIKKKEVMIKEKLPKEILTKRIQTQCESMKRTQTSPKRCVSLSTDKLPRKLIVKKVNRRLDYATNVPEKDDFVDKLTKLFTFFEEKKSVKEPVKEPVKECLKSKVNVEDTKPSKKEIVKINSINTQTINVEKKPEYLNMRQYLSLQNEILSKEEDKFCLEPDLMFDWNSDGSASV